MSESKHTAGPWTVRENSAEGKCLFHSIHDPDERYIASTWGKPNEDDANLIAAAPELLSVLKDLIGSLPSAEYMAARGETEGPMLIRARAAIAKAEGRS